MLSLRNRLWSAFALVLGTLLVVTVFAVPAEAAITRYLSISVSPTTVNAGAQVSFSGRLKNSPTGSTVKIQRKVGTSWVTAKSTQTTSSYGGYRVKVTMPSTPGKYQFRSIAGASSKYSRAISPSVTATALRKVIVKLASNKSTISVGETIELSGKAYPFVRGTVATIQRFNGIKWTTLVTTTISSTGTFKRLLKPGASTTYRAVVPRTGLLATGVSAAVSVQIPTGPVAPEITTTSLADAATDKPYGKTLQVDGEAGIWAVTSGSLPPGLSLSSGTGVISGTPTTGGTYPFTVTYSENETLLSDSQALSIKVLVSPRITTTALPDATGYVTYSPFTLQKTGQAGSWAMTGSLPDGMAFNTTTGVISGKPTVKSAGNYPLSFTFTETAAPNLSVSKNLTLHLNAAPNPVITTSALPAATGFATYSPFTLQKTGNAGTWSIDTGSLPPGMSFNTATGVISGKPTIKDAADYGVTFRFTETESTTFGTKFLTLHVNAAAKPVISTTSLPFGVISRDYDAPALAVSTPRPGTWSVASGSLPTGITLDSATGVLSGVPSAVGTFSVTFRFTETESGTTDTQALSIVVYSLPVVTTTALPDAWEDSTGSPFSTFLSSSGGSSSKSWSLAGGTLPPGVTLSSTGKLSGTATTGGNYTFTVRINDTITGEFGDKELTIYVGPVVIFTATTPAGKVGQAYSLQFDGRPYNLFYVGWSIDSGTLPPGLTLSSTGRLSGTPTLPGDYTFSVEYLSLADARVRQYTLHVDP